jgi:acyl carrier protein|tara:strand:+ start:6683 stop:6910 length:228 start_codon:yes stop_codon:yes gene_type:complete
MDKKLEIVFKKVFPKFKGKLNDKTSPKNILEWDSLNHLNLIAEVAKKFKTNFDFNEILQINKIGDLKKILKKKNV